MGYAVYEDIPARDYGVSRWAGYGVPAICDMPGCETKINRGMGYRCERIYESQFVDDDEIGVEADGCQLHFCVEHSGHDEHKSAIPKPDVPQWEHHILRDSSWAQWREENPKLIPGMEERPKDFQCSEDCEHD